jgi:3-methyladenine DNA glycosylase/8-oxoguanine DNA glycosylase
MRKIERSKENEARKIARTLVKNEWMAGYKKGLEDGAKEQRKQDNELLVKKLQGLTDLKGIGEKTAERIIEYFLEGFEK